MKEGSWRKRRGGDEGEDSGMRKASLLWLPSHAQMKTVPAPPALKCQNHTTCPASLLSSIMMIQESMISKCEAEFPDVFLFFSSFLFPSVSWACCWSHTEREHSLSGGQSIFYFLPQQQIITAFPYNMGFPLNLRDPWYLPTVLVWTDLYGSNWGTPRHCT